MVRGFTKVGHNIATKPPPELTVLSDGLNWGRIHFQAPRVAEFLALRASVPCFIRVCTLEDNK